MSERIVPSLIGHLLVVAALTLLQCLQPLLHAHPRSASLAECAPAGGAFACRGSLLVGEIHLPDLSRPVLGSDPVRLSPPLLPHRTTRGACCAVNLIWRTRCGRFGRARWTAGLPSLSPVRGRRLPDRVRQGPRRACPEQLPMP